MRGLPRRVLDQVQNCLYVCWCQLIQAYGGGCSTLETRVRVSWSPNPAGGQSGTGSHCSEVHQGFAFTSAFLVSSAWQDVSSLQLHPKVLHIAACSILHVMLLLVWSSIQKDHRNVYSRFFRCHDTKECSNKKDAKKPFHDICTVWAKESTNHYCLRLSIWNIERKPMFNWIVSLQFGSYMQINHVGCTQSSPLIC